MNAPKWSSIKNGTNRNLVRGAILAVAVVLLAVLVFRQVQRSRGVTVTVKVPVASEDLETGAVVEAEQLTEADFSLEDLPAGTVRFAVNIEGRALAKAKAAGVPFVRADFAAPQAPPGLAGILPEGRVLMFVPVSGLPMGDIAAELRFGDRFDLLALQGRRPGLEDPIFTSRAWTVARDVYYLGWVSPRGPGGAPQSNDDEDSQDEGLGRLLTSAVEAQAGPSGGGGGGGMSALLLGLHPEDVMPLAEAQAAGAPMALVLHGRKEVEAGELLVLPRPRLNEVELIRGDSRTRIPLRRPRLR